MKIASAVTLWTLQVPVAVQAQPKPALTITLDGGGFNARQFTLTPVVATYANNVWRAKSDTRINRIELNSYDDPGTEFRIGVPPVTGVYVFDKRDEEREGRNPYLGFDLKLADPGAATLRFFRADHVEVVITRLDPPGGRIEGTLSGTLGGPESVIVKVNGRFSVVRRTNSARRLGRPCDGAKSLRNGRSHEEARSIPTRLEQRTSATGACSLRNAVRHRGCG